MNTNELAQMLSRLSAQTGTPMPSAAEVERFLSSPASRLLLQSLQQNRAQSSALSQAAAQAQSGNIAGAAQLVGSYLNTPEGQQLLSVLRGGAHG